MVYYGHTVQRLSKRKATHVDRAKPETQSTCSSRVIIEAGAYRIVWLEDWPCANVDEARARERWWIENHPCVNKNVPNRTTKQWRNDNAELVSRRKKKNYQKNRDKILSKDKERYTDNREKILKNRKEHRVKNKETIQKYKKQPWTCSLCHSSMKLGTRSQHRHSCYKRFCDAFGIDAHFDGLKITE